MQNNAYSKLDSISITTEESWDDPSAGIESPILIEKANKSIDLLDYISEKISLDTIVSHSGWTRRTFCPFHKGGLERTPSFFINPYKNIFYCQACEAKGGVVQYLSLQQSIPESLVASFILQSFDIKITELSEEKKKLEDKRRVQKALVVLSTIFNSFLKSHQDDEEAFDFANKAMEGFDNAHALNKKGVESNIDEVILNLENYFISYDRR
jgi:DNA primase